MATRRKKPTPAPPAPTSVGPTLPNGVRVAIARDPGGPTITLSDVPPAEVHNALDWLEEVWKARRIPVPYHTDVVPGNSAPTFVDDEHGYYGRRPGFRVPPPSTGG